MSDWEEVWCKKVNESIYKQPFFIVILEKCVIDASFLQVVVVDVYFLPFKKNIRFEFPDKLVEQ